MRCLISFVFVLTLVASPWSVSAQAGEEGANPEQPISAPAAGTEVPDVETLSRRAIEHHETRSAQHTKTPDQQRARSGLIASSVIVAAGAAMVGGGVAVGRNTDELSGLGPAVGLSFVGGALMVGGIIGIGISGRRLSIAKRKQRDRTRETDDRRPRRAQWDVARSRLVF